MTANIPQIKIQKKSIYNQLKHWLLTASPPGFQDLPLSYVIHFFLKGFQKGSLVTRASAIAFNILLSILPSMIFLFTLIPFIPIPDFQKQLLILFESLLPENVFSLLENTITQVVTEKRNGLLIFIFLATILFSTNGIHAVINAFIVTSHKFKTRTWISQRITSLFLVFATFMMLSVAIIIMVGGLFSMDKLEELNIIKLNSTYFLFSAAKWILFLILIFFAISTLYYKIPAEEKEWRFFSPGSIMATFLFLVSSIGFTAYVNNFGQYNKLYGSIGTFMVIFQFNKLIGRF